METATQSVPVGKGSMSSGNATASSEHRAWKLEGAYQAGEETFRGGIDQDIQAGFASAILGYTWNNVAWTPTLKGLFWYGSGDDDPTDGTNNTVSTLFPPGHTYWGIIDNLNGQNLLDCSIRGSVKPTSKLTVVSALHWFEKAESSAPIYNVAGAPFPNPCRSGYNGR